MWLCLGQTNVSRGGKNHFQVEFEGQHAVFPLYQHQQHLVSSGSQICLCHLRGHWQCLKTLFGQHDSEGGSCYLYLVSRSQVCPKYYTMQRTTLTPPTLDNKNLSSPNINSVTAETPWLGDRKTWVVVPNCP